MQQTSEPFLMLVPRAGVEPATYRLGAQFPHKSVQTNPNKLKDLVVWLCGHLGTFEAISVPPV